MDRQTKMDLDCVCASIGCKLNAEQEEFAADFRSPIISFSDPGTGKTHSTVAGLIMAQTYGGVAGRKINAMSFTKAATAELKGRYDKACGRAHITPTVQFRTFSSICYDIVSKYMENFNVTMGIDYTRDLPLFQRYMEQEGVKTEDMFYVRDVLLSVNKLNSALTFDPKNVETKYSYKYTNLSMATFQALRGDWFTMGLLTKTITRGDLPLYALYALLTKPDLRKRYREQFDIMVVDEFQDLSLLHLKILSLIAGNLVAIGDMKQQIYAFNGSSQQIVQEYKRIYPAAREINLTQSYRCTCEVADFATKIIQNNMDGVDARFRGIGDGGEVTMLSNRDMDKVQIVSNIKKEQDKCSTEDKARTFMFLFRNNFTAIPIIEECYKQGVLFQSNKFMKVMDVPTYKERTTLALAAMYPNDIDIVKEATYLFPEFKEYKRDKVPLIMVMQKTGLGLLDIDYRFKEESSIKFMNALKKVELFIKRKAKASTIYEILMPIYDEFILKGKWWTLDCEKGFYDSLVLSVTTTKEFGQMIAEERDKERINVDNTTVHRGVRCYTVHAGKGLEADEVFLLDADDGVFPGRKQLDRLLSAGCDIEAATELRNERNLLYVAATRAKSHLWVAYNERVTQLLSNPITNEYTVLDAIYRNVDRDYDDVEFFMKVFSIRQQGHIVKSVSQQKSNMAETEEEINIEDL